MKPKNPKRWRPPSPAFSSVRICRWRVTLPSLSSMRRQGVGALASRSRKQRLKPVHRMLVSRAETKRSQPGFAETMQVLGSTWVQLVPPRQGARMSGEMAPRVMAISSLLSRNGDGSTGHRVPFCSCPLGEGHRNSGGTVEKKLSSSSLQGLTLVVHVLNSSSTSQLNLSSSCW